jgi:hypothetical protein
VQRGNGFSDLFGIDETGGVAEGEKERKPGLPKGIFYATKEQLNRYFDEEGEIRLNLFANQVLRLRSLKARREKLERFRRIHGDEMVEMVKNLVAQRFKEKSGGSS